MEKNRNVKRWAVLALAGLLTLPILGWPQIVDASSSGAGTGAYIANGTYHIAQFGGYDINSEVAVVDGKITDVKIIGGNFGRTYAEINIEKLQNAIDGIVEKFGGLAGNDSEGIQKLDTVTGATYSSNGIKESVADALGLELTEETKVNVAEKTPEAGTYDVTVAVRSDVIDHSLVQTETTQAQLTVGEDGQMRLSYRMISETEQEPMYILNFNGYYEDNNPEGMLSTEGVTYATETRGDYTVVTDVSFPLAGLSQYYYNNTRIYVPPAMSNLNGEIKGIYFENGQFNIKTIVTMYWDTLKKRDVAESGQQSMNITANVANEISRPCGTVRIPSVLSMGELKSTEDNVQPYEVQVSTTSSKSRITVSAPEGGMLYSEKDELPFSNDFGVQTVQGDGMTDSGAVALLKGNIIILGKDVAEASPGNYTGVTTFTISCGIDGNSGGGDSDRHNEDSDKSSPSGRSLDSQKFTANVKTGNIIGNDGLWLVILTVGCGALGVGIIKMVCFNKYKRRP